MTATVQVAPSRADFLLLRQSVLLYLGNGGRADPHVLREAIGRTEWKTLDRDRRIWALGSAAGDLAPFEAAQSLADKTWSELDTEVRRVLAERVLKWVRQE